MPISSLHTLAIAAIREREPAMKIGQSHDPQRTSHLQPALDGRARAPASAGAVEPVEAGERIELSAATRSMVSAGTDTSNPIREHKVEEIRRAIQEGSFHVSAQAVADRMIAEAAELVEAIARGTNR